MRSALRAAHHSCRTRPVAAAADAVKATSWQTAGQTPTPPAARSKPFRSSLTCHLAAFLCNAAASCLHPFQIIRLEALLEAERLQFSFTERKLQQLLGHERVRCDHMRALRDDAVMQR